MAKGRGGKRPGAGRPKGSANRLTRQAVAEAEASGIMPRDQMLFTMRWLHSQGRYVEAASVARDVAPYYHSRRSPVLEAPDGQDAPLTDERRLALLLVLLERARQGGARPAALPGPAPAVGHKEE
jgi:hypothetical protein